MKKLLVNLAPVVLLLATTRFAFSDERSRHGGATVATSHASPSSHGQGQLVTAPLYTGVIVPDAFVPSFILAFFGREVDGYWTPRVDDVARLEAALPAYLRQTAATRSSDLWQRLPEYRRQYVGLVENGHKRILVNALCDDLGIDWRTTPVAVLDGGDCYFQVTYDVTAGAFSDLMVNGEA